MCARLIPLAFAALISLATCGCGDPSQAAKAPAKDPETSNNQYTVASTIAMVTDIVRNVAANRADTIGLIDAGVDPHLYKPTRSDIRRLLNADIIFYNGLLLEGKMTDALVRAASAGKKVHPVTELLDHQYLLQPDHRADHHDPHVWMDPQAWAKAVEVVRDKLIDFDPAGKQAYHDNAARYLARLDQLDEYASRTLATVPKQQRVLVTAHDAFNYFGRRFGYDVVGIQGLSTESEAGVQDIERLVDLIVNRNVAAVFVESTVSQRNINALIAGANARNHNVKIGGQLFSDAMGPDGTYEGTYIGMIDHNVTTIARALGGQAPQRGMNGKLKP